MTIPTADQLRPLFLKLPPAEIVYLRAILESYEGIAEIRTLNPETGVIVALGLEDTIDDLKAIVAELAETCSVREIPMPDEVKGDWLLEEYYQKSG